MKTVEIIKLIVIMKTVGLIPIGSLLAYFWTQGEFFLLPKL